MFGDDNKPHLGHYKLESKLGEGGMGVVYRATDEKLSREVAIKVLHPHLLKHENLKERFRREARMHAKIIHPNIVTLLSLFEDGDHMALVMEMIHGKNLKEYLREHPRPDLADVIRISEAILSGLDAAHRQGMVHRDLKPANVMLAANGDIKLMDFGLAKPKHGDDDLTQSGATVGSFRYMAPEQIMNQPVDVRTDLYAFGILLYQMLTGKLPFDSTSSGGEFEIMEKQVRHDPTAPKELNPLLPSDLSDLVMRLLAKDKDSRPGNCEVVQRKLLEILQQAERLRSHASQIIARPAIKQEENAREIARGLIRAWSRQFVRMLVNAAWQVRVWTWEKPSSYLRDRRIQQQAGLEMPAGNSGRMARFGQGVKERWSRAVKGPVRAVKGGVSAVKGGAQAVKRSAQAVKGRVRAVKWQGPLIWGGVALSLVVLGWVLVSVIHVAERPAGKATVASSTGQPSQKVPAAASPEKKAPSSTPASTTKVAKSKPAPAPAKKVAKAAPEKPKPKPAPRHRTVRKAKPAPRRTHTASSSRASVTYKVAYKVRNSEADEINPHRPNEFRGGSRLYFPTLKDNRTGFFRAYKKGWVRLYFEKPVRLSAIRIHRISAGSADFKGGRIELAVQNERGHWTVLLRRKDRDIDSPLLVHGSRKAMAEVKGVRLRFTSPAPLTVGPIDLLP